MILVLMNYWMSAVKMKFNIKLTYSDYQEIAMYENLYVPFKIMNLYTDTLERWDALY